MQTEASNQIPLTFCDHCEATIVTFRELDDLERVQVYCSRCGSHLGGAGEIEEFDASPSLLEALGYGVEEVRPKGGAGGCRTKGGSCGCSKKKPKAALQTKSVSLEVKIPSTNQREATTVPGDPRKFEA
jgi:hypothetical protein